MSIAVTTVVYIIVVIMTGSTSVRYADGINFPELISSTNDAQGLTNNFTANSSSDSFNNKAFLGASETYGSDWIFLSYKAPLCSVNNSCPYGLMNYFQVFFIFFIKYIL